MKHAFQFTLILLIGEIISFFIFKFINKILQNNWDLKFSRDVFKGILERLFIFLALVKGIPQSIIAFGAIKIATRFVEENENKISNDYFFIGNITSLLITIFYYSIWKLIV